MHKIVFKVNSFLLRVKIARLSLSKRKQKQLIFVCFLKRKEGWNICLNYLYCLKTLKNG
jgi:hypothetical protein